MNQLSENSEWEEYYFGASRGRIGSKEPIAQGVHKANDEEVDEYREAVKELRKWAKSDAFVLVEHSFKRYQMAVGQLTKDFQTKAPTTLDSAKLTLNAEFIGLLCMFRFYIDQTETMLSRHNSSDAKTEYDSFKKATAAEYDKYFAYRFCWQLRNYAQHCGLPITNVRFISKTEGDSPIFLAMSLLEIQFSRDTLLQNFDGWQNIEEDLKRQPEKIFVTPIAEQLLECLRRIQKTALQSRYERLKEAAETIRKAATYANGTDGYPCLLTFHLAGDKSNPTLQSISHEFAPMSLVEEVGKIESME
jgi:hypothetical protein